MSLFSGGGEDYSFSIKSILVVVWISGIFIRLISLCIKYCHFKTAVKQFIKVEDKHILDTVNIICHKLNIKSIPEIYMTTDNYSPSEYGLFRQKIVLNSIQYTDEEMYYILLHEITHHKLKNDLAKCFAKMLEIIFWWDPVVYLLYDRIDKLMEIYTDLSITKNLNQTQKYEYLKCLCSVYKTININSISATAFASPVIGRVKESEIVKRFKIAAKGIKNNVSVCVFAVALILVCNFSTFRFVYQPYYDAPFQGILYVQIDFNHSNSYIVKEGDHYVLYYNGEPFIGSDKIEDLERLFSDDKRGDGE